MIYKGRDYHPKQELLTLGSSGLAYTFHKITRGGSQFHFSALHYSEVVDLLCWNKKIELVLNKLNFKIHVW